jgi:hypothetical protein
MEIKKRMTRPQDQTPADLKGFWFEGIIVDVPIRIDLIFIAGSNIYYSLNFNKSIKFKKNL